MLARTWIPVRRFFQIEIILISLIFFYLALEPVLLRQVSRGYPLE